MEVMMVFILFFLISLFAVPLQGMETKHANSIVLSPEMQKFARLKNKKQIMQALASMNTATRTEVFRCFPGLEYSFPKEGLKYMQYTKKRADIPVSEPKPKKKKNNKKKKPKKIAPGKNASGVAQKSDEKHTTKKIFVFFNDFLEFLYYFFTDPTKYPSEKFEAIELLLNDVVFKQQEVQRITERFVRETGISISCARKCIEMQSDYFTELAQIETSKKAFVTMQLVETFFARYNKGLTEFTEKSKENKREMLRSAARNGTLTRELEQSLATQTKECDDRLQQILANNARALKIAQKDWETLDPKDVLDMLTRIIAAYKKDLEDEGPENASIIKMFDGIGSMLKFTSDKRFVDQEVILARQFAKDAEQFLKQSVFIQKADKIKRQIIIEIYKSNLNEREFFTQFAREFAQRSKKISQAETTIKRESPILFASEDAYQDEDEKAKEQVPEAKAATPQIANGTVTGLTPSATVTGFIPVTSKGLVRKKLTKLRKAPHYAYMTSCLQPQADTYVITEDAKMLEVKIPDKNIKLIVAKAGTEPQSPWFTCYNRNIGKAGKQDDQHMLLPPLVIDDMLQNFSCCENSYISSVFHRPIVIKNFPVQVKSLDEQTPARLGCLQIAIDNGVCFHRMFKERDLLDYGLQCFVDAAFGQV